MTLDKIHELDMTIQLLENEMDTIDNRLDTLHSKRHEYLKINMIENASQYVGNWYQNESECIEVLGMKESKLNDEWKLFFFVRIYRWRFPYNTKREHTYATGIELSLQELTVDRVMKYTQLMKDHEITYLQQYVQQLTGSE